MKKKDFDKMISMLNVLPPLKEVCPFADTNDRFAFEVAMASIALLLDAKLQNYFGTNPVIKYI